MQLLRSLAVFAIALSGFWIWLQSRPLGPGPTVDPILEPHVRDWLGLMSDNDLDVKRPFSQLRSIMVTRLEPGIVGNFHTWTNEIKISDQVLDRGKFSTRAAVYHELGHSIFGLNHSQEIGIMYRYSMSESYYRQNWNELEKLYISNCKRNELELKLK